MSDPRSLKDRIVVVTGAGQGIGRAYAQAVAADGGTAVIAEINEERAQAVASEITSEGGSAVAFGLDVSSEESCREFAEVVASQFGRVDGLVNNAAIFSTIKMKAFSDITVREWDALMSVNLRGPWLLTTALLPLLRAGRSASVVNIASDAVWLGRPGYAHYVASKGGVAAMTFALSHELGGDGIRINTVSPGPTYTEVDRETVSPEQHEAMLARQSLARDAHPDDMVGPVTFLLSEASKFVTGQTIHVNGGMLHF